MYKTMVIEYFGKPIVLAELLGISPAAISQWGETIPEKNAYRIQELTNGELKVDHHLYRKQ